MDGNPIDDLIKTNQKLSGITFTPEEIEEMKSSYQGNPELAFQDMVNTVQKARNIKFSYKERLDMKAQYGVPMAWVDIMALSENPELKTGLKNKAGESSAAGLWQVTSVHEPNIRKMFGVSHSDFIKDANKQERYVKEKLEPEYDKNLSEFRDTVEEGVKEGKFKDYEKYMVNGRFTDDQIKAMNHLLGSSGARYFFNNGTFTGTEPDRKARDAKRTLQQMVGLRKQYGVPTSLQDQYNFGDVVKQAAEEVTAATTPTLGGGQASVQKGPKIAGQSTDIDWGAGTVTTKFDKKQIKAEAKKKTTPTTPQGEPQFGVGRSVVDLQVTDKGESTQNAGQVFRSGAPNKNAVPVAKRPVETAPEEPGVIEQVAEGAANIITDYFGEEGLGFVNAVRRGLNSGELADILALGRTPTKEEMRRIAEIQKENQGYKSSGAYEKFINSEGFDAVTSFAEDPFEILSQLVTESLVAQVRHGYSRGLAGATIGAGIGATALGAGAIPGAGFGFAAGMGLAGLNLEMASSILESLQDAGIDTTSETSLEEGFSNEELMSKARSFALKRGVPIGIFDALSAGVAGKFFGKPAMTLLGKVGKGAAEIGSQMGFAAAGETAAQVASGQKINTTAILAESLGEVGGGLPEIAVGTVVEAKRVGVPLKDLLFKTNLPKQKFDDMIDISEGAGQLTPQQADEIKQEYADVSQTKDKIPNEYKDNKVVFDLLKERETLTNQMASADPVFVDEYKAKIDEINKKIQEETVNQKQQVEAKKTTTKAEISTKKAYDFDDTLFDNKTGKLTKLGEDVKKRIEAGEDIVIVTARGENQTQQIQDVLGVGVDKIEATGDEAKKPEALQKRGISPQEYYDENQEKLAAIQGVAAPSTTAAAGLTKEQQTELDKVNKRAERIQRTLQEDAAVQEEGDEPLLTAEQKKILETELQTLNQKRDAIQKQSTAEVPIQPRAEGGQEVGGQVQAKSEGPAGKGKGKGQAKAEEEVTPTPTTTGKVAPKAAEAPQKANTVQGFEITRKDGSKLPASDYVKDKKTGKWKRVAADGTIKGVSFAPYVKQLEDALSSPAAAETKKAAPAKTPDALKDVESTTKALKGKTKGLLTEPTTEQLAKETKDKNVVTFNFDKESDVPNAFKDKISSRGEVNGKKVIRVTLPKSMADYLLAKDDPQAISEAYHKAKKDNSNPALVEAVEGLLGVAPSQPAAPKVKMPALKETDKTTEQSGTKYTLAEDLTVHKGTKGKRNIDGTLRTAHPNAKGSFTAADIKIAERYKGDGTIISTTLPAGTTIEVVKVDLGNIPASQYRDLETEAINSSDADVVKLITMDAKLIESQYVIRNQKLRDELRKKGDLEKTAADVEVTAQSQPAAEGKDRGETATPPMETVLEQIGSTKAKITDQIYRFFTKAAAQNDAEAKEMAKLTFAIWERVGQYFGGKNGTDWIKSKIQSLGRTSATQAGKLGEVRLQSPTVQAAELAEAAERVANNIVEHIDSLITKGRKVLAAEKDKAERKRIQQSLQSLKDTKEQVQKARKDPRFQVDAYHGTPYVFDKFTTEKIGTGEGAQAFGWGLYFTDLESIARGYAKKLASISPGIAATDLNLNNKSLKDGTVERMGKNSATDLFFEWLNNVYSVDKKDFKERIKKVSPISLYPVSDTEVDENNPKYKAAEDKVEKEGYENQYDYADKMYKEGYDVKIDSAYGEVIGVYEIKIPKNADQIAKDIEKIKKFLLDNIDNDNIKGFEKRNLYKTNLFQGKKPGEYTLLEWDKPLSRDFINKMIDGDIVNLTVQEALLNYYGEKGEYDITTVEGLKDTIENEGLTGQELYNILSLNTEEATPKSASIALLNAGIDGIKYPAESIARGTTSDTARGFNYVIFDENDIAINERVQFQQEAAEFRAATIALANNKFIVAALESPNASSFVHEEFHTFEDSLSTAERQTLLDSYNENYGEKETEWTTDVSEWGARLWEKYFSNGRKLTEAEVKDKATRTKLQEIFDKFTEYLKGIYDGVIQYTNSKGATKEVNISPEVQALFDKIMGITPTAAETKNKAETKTAEQLSEDIQATTEAETAKEKMQTKDPVQMAGQDLVNNPESASSIPNDVAAALLEYAEGLKINLGGFKKICK